MSTDWWPTAGLAALRQRAGALARIRGFFDERGVLEVETPVVAADTVTDPMLAAIAIDSPGTEAPCDARYWLQTSPEYPMKRLLAAGSGAIYQIARVFRRADRGSLHNPEFSMLEWYRPGFGYADLIQEVSDLLAVLLAKRPVVVLTYTEVFVQQLGIEPLTASDAELRAVASHKGINAPADLDRDAMLDLLMGTLIAPRLGRDCWCYLTGFPASQASLARLDPQDPRIAERFECFIDGMEIANGFRELTDPQAQRARFEADQAVRRERGETAPPAIDERLLTALEAGLPECSGVALGLDRLLMVAIGATTIDEVMAFPIEHA